MVRPMCLKFPKIAKAEAKADLNQYKIPFGQPLREVFSETISHIATYDVPADSA